MLHFSLFTLGLSSGLMFDMRNRCGMGVHWVPDGSHMCILILSDQYQLNVTTFLNLILSVGEVLLEGGPAICGGVNDYMA